MAVERAKRRGEDTGDKGKVVPDKYLITLSDTVLTLYNLGFGPYPGETHISLETIFSIRENEIQLI